jgi:uncharacterized protein
MRGLFKRAGSAALPGLLLAATAFAAIPPVPSDHFFIQDYAGILPTETRDRIGHIQDRAFTSNDTPIVVVTVRTMADYGFAGSTIEQFATQWFNTWQIGKRAPDGTLINRGMLLIVSVGDRKARIELGADWAHDADAHAKGIMDNAIIPSFKQGNFPEGIHNGVAALAELAGVGPANVPKPSPTETVTQWVDQAAGSAQVTTSPLPKHIILIASALGALLIGLSFVFPNQRKFLLGAGIVLILGAWLFWAMLFVFALLTKGGKGSRGGSSGGGFSSSGGFSSGGFSGGGGASGSW